MRIIINEILILLATTPCSLVSYHILRGTSCLGMKAEGSFRRC